MMSRTNKRVALSAALVTGFVGVWQCFAGTMEVWFPEYTRGETLTDFPAVVVLNRNAGGFSYDGFLSPNGYDLRFSNATETVALDYEIEAWDTNGTSYVWVRVPEFTSNCMIRAYWGNPAATEQPASCTNGSVWTSPYKGVWHLSPSLADSTTYANNGYHPTNATLDVEGPLGRARQTGIGRNIRMSGASAHLALTNTFTYSFWSKASYPTAGGGYIYQFNATGGGGQIGLICGFSKNVLQFYVANDYTNYDGTGHPGGVSAITVQDGGWHHYAYSNDGAVWMGFLDGAPIFKLDMAFGLWPKKTPYEVRIGASIAGDYFNGAVDEMRVEDAGRSTNWIYACFLNQARAMIRSATVRFPEYDRGETLTNFPALVVLNEKLEGFSYNTFRSPAGYDLRFRDSTDTVNLDYEIETWNPQGSSYVWVRVPEFTSNCLIRAYWGNPADAVQPVSCTNGAVWPEPFRGVWHLAPDLKDSTAYKNNATGTGTADLRGPVGASARRTALNASIAPQGNSEQLAVSNRFTFSFWAQKVVPATGNTYAYQLMTDAGGQMGMLYGYTANTLQFYAGGLYVGQNPGYGGSISDIRFPDSGWHHYAYTYDGAYLTGTRDGEVIVRPAVSFVFNIPPGRNRIRIGSSQTADYFKGGIDEFRVEVAGRSTNWLYACYRNQRVRREGFDYLNYPVFGARGTVSDVGSVSAKAGAYLSCRYPAAARLFYGTADGGEDPDGWGTSLNLGTRNTGLVSTNLTGLLPDRNYVYRCFASNGLGVAWSAPFTFRTAPDAAFSQYMFKMRIDFAGYTADETLTNFPVAVVFSERIAGFKYGTFASEAGRDLRFVDGNGRLLNYEIETWDTGGDSTVWVQMPEFRTNNYVWAYWGNKDAADQPAYCANGDVWEPAFCGVYHLTPALKDSAFGANHVVSNTLTQTAGGKVSYARSFTNSASLLLGTSGSLGVSDAFTFSVWAKTAYPCSTGMYLYGRQPANQPSQLHGVICGYATNRVEFYAAGYGGTSNPCASSALSILDDGWHQYVYTYNGTVWAGYCDGEPVFSREGFFSLAFTDEFTVNPARIGSNILLSNPLTGSLDEFRVERAGRTANWIRASYANQNAPETFSVCGEALSLRGTVLMLQ